MTIIQTFYGILQAMNNICFMYFKMLINKRALLYLDNLSYLIVFLCTIIEKILVLSYDKVILNNSKCISYSIIFVLK